MSRSQPLSQYQGSAQYEGYTGPATGAVGPPPRTSPCAHTVAAPALVQSAEAVGGLNTLRGMVATASPTSTYRCAPMFVAFQPASLVSRDDIGCRSDARCIE